MSPRRYKELEIPPEDLSFGRRLGQGGFGTVWKAVYNTTVVAVKQMKPDVDSWNAKHLHACRREMRTLLRLRHPHIVPPTPTEHLYSQNEQIEAGFRISSITSATSTGI